MDQKIESWDQCIPTQGGLRPASRGAYRDGDARSDRADKGRLDRLATVIVEEIAPRLRALHHPARPVAPEKAPDASVISEFCALVVAPDGSRSTAYFEKLREHGYSSDTLFVHLLAPTARHLGELWQDDRCDFVDVTLGLVRLQELLEFYSAPAESPLQDRRRTALLIAPAGELHRFGLEMVAQFMREAGWSVDVKADLTPRQSAELVASDWIGVAGLTLGRDASVDAVARTIEAIRRASLNPAIGVLVGGSAFASDPDLVAQVGADAAALDAPTAVIVAKQLLLRQTTGGA